MCVLIAQAVFLLDLENRQTDATERPPHAGSYTADMGNEPFYTVNVLLLLLRIPLQC